MHEGSVNETVSETSNDLNSALADFGDTPGKRKYRARKARGLLEQRRSLGPRAHVVSQPRWNAGRGEVKEPAFNRPADSEWRPQNMATRRLDERVPPATSLMGYDPDRIAESDYPWTVP